MCVVDIARQLHQQHMHECQHVASQSVQPLIAHAGVQNAPAANAHLLEGALAGGPNNGAVQQGPSTFDQSSCECAPHPIAQARAISFS